MLFNTINYFNILTLPLRTETIINLISDLKIISKPYNRF